jgi:hypothetical protein
MSNKISALGSAKISKPLSSKTSPKPSDVQARRRASKALANAKQRCSNLKDPNYATYGALGIRMLFSGVGALISAIGLPKLGQSLDRIDPNGHYEAGNVRWANAAVQAANKKASPQNAYLSVTSQMVLAKEELALREHRKLTSIAWVRCLSAFNLGYLRQDYAEWLDQHFSCPGLIAANFDFDTVYDWANPSPGYIHLPALSLPEARVRIRCNPLVERPVHDALRRLGRLSGLEYLGVEWNVPAQIWNKVHAAIQTKAAGIILYGQPTVDDLLGGWIEGCSLAMASVISTNLKITAACLPILRVQEILKNLGSPDCWDEIEHPLLDTCVLLIPDFSLDCGGWGSDKPITWWKVAALQKYRYEKGLQTIIGVQNVKKLPPAVKDIALGAYQLAPMPHVKAHSLEDMQHTSAQHGVPEGCTTLRSMRAHPNLCNLAAV